MPQFFNIKEYWKKNSWNFKFVCFFRLLFHWKFLQWEFWIIHLLHIEKIRANNTSACISCITVRWKHKYNFYIIISDLFCSVMYTMCVYSTGWFFFIVSFQLSINNDDGDGDDDSTTFHSKDCCLYIIYSVYKCGYDTFILMNIFFVLNQMMMIIKQQWMILVLVSWINISCVWHI